MCATRLGNKSKERGAIGSPADVNRRKGSFPGESSKRWSSLALLFADLRAGTCVAIGRQHVSQMFLFVVGTRSSRLHRIADEADDESITGRQKAGMLRMGSGSGPGNASPLVLWTLLTSAPTWRENRRLRRAALCFDAFRTVLWASNVLVTAHFSLVEPGQDMGNAWRQWSTGEYLDMLATVRL